MPHTGCAHLAALPGTQVLDADRDGFLSEQELRQLFYCFYTLLSVFAQDMADLPVESARKIIEVRRCVCVGEQP